MAHAGQGFVAMWVVMAIVMMVPTALRPARRISEGDPWRFIAFLAGYAGLWSLSVLVAYPLVVWVPWTPLALFLGWIAVGFYQLLPSTSQHLRACRTLHASDRPGRSGMRYGVSCASACLPLMIVAMATVHGAGVPLGISIALMAVVMGYIMWEKSSRATFTAIRFSGAMMIALAAITFTSGALPDHGVHSARGAQSLMGESRS
jgi:hypothetical protein